jgi:hypothetical protein
MSLAEKPLGNRTNLRSQFTPGELELIESATDGTIDMILGQISEERSNNKKPPINSNLHNYATNEVAKRRQ